MSANVKIWPVIPRAQPHLTFRTEIKVKRRFYKPYEATWRRGSYCVMVVGENFWTKAAAQSWLDRERAVWGSPPPECTHNTAEVINLGDHRN